MLFQTWSKSKFRSKTNQRNKWKSARWNFFDSHKNLIINFRDMEPNGELPNLLYSKMKKGMKQDTKVSEVVTWLFSKNSTSGQEMNTRLQWSRNVHLIAWVRKMESAHSSNWLSNNGHKTSWSRRTSNQSKSRAIYANRYDSHLWYNKSTRKNI